MIKSKFIQLLKSCPTHELMTEEFTEETQMKTKTKIVKKVLLAYGGEISVMPLEIYKASEPEKMDKAIIKYSTWIEEYNYLLKRTSYNTIKSALRIIWLKSTERRYALKRDKYCCQKCGIKQSKAVGKEVKVQVHHKDSITNWAEIVEYLREKLLCDPEHLETLCEDCHQISEVERSVDKWIEERSNE